MLSGTHQTGGGVTPFDGRSVRSSVAKLSQSVVDALFGAMPIDNLNRLQLFAAAVLDDLDMRRRTWDTVTYVAGSPNSTVARWAIRCG